MLLQSVLDASNIIHDYVGSDVGSHNPRFNMFQCLNKAALS